MKSNIILLILILISSCSTPSIVFIDKQVQPTYDKFIDHYMLYIGNPPPEAILVHLKDLNDREGHYLINENITHLDSLTWLTASVSYKELLLYHEMGHHILKRLHKNNLFKDGCPTSIMYYKLHDDCYKTHKDYYIEELFSINGEF